MLNCNYNKKGQIGETVSWLVATLVIVGILIIFIFISVLMSKAKTIAIGDLQTDINKESSLQVKTNLAFNIENKNKNDINEILKQFQNG
jgi:hypothetical protein